MRFFKLLAENLPVQDMQDAVLAHPELWNANRSRTTFEGTAHGGVDDILIHYGDTPKDLTCRWHPAAFVLPVFPLLRGLVFQMGAYEVQRVLISKLQPGRAVLAHHDLDGYAGQDALVRYHMILKGEERNFYRCGDETVEMRTGQLWWFDHTAIHECLNDGLEDRIHLMIDVRRFPVADSPG